MDCSGCSSHIVIDPKLVLPVMVLCVLGLAGCNRPSQARAEHRERSRPSPESLLREDSDRDGIPDAAELHSFDDRENFRSWFTAIAEMQFYRVSETWKEEQRDCAGLVRFAWREALRKHDRLWVQEMGEGFERVAEDVRAYTLDRSPLGDKLFRADFGSFEESDLAANKFSEFADARTLKNHNAVFVGRDRQLARPGDLFFFHQPGRQKFPYHVMIFLGEARQAGEGARDWVVYHTGVSSADHGDKGEVKKVRLSVLELHPDKRWRPVANNHHYLGVYRLKILE